jgi:hypothetical protein
MVSLGAKAIIDTMREEGIPLTRENFIEFADIDPESAEELADVPNFDEEGTYDFDPDQPRDPTGKWTSGGGGGPVGSASAERGGGTGGNTGVATPPGKAAASRFDPAEVEAARSAARKTER